MHYLEAQGWIRPAERELLARLAGEVPSGETVVNIGVEFGASLACLCAGGNGVAVVAFDMDISKVQEKGYCAALYEQSSLEAIKGWKKPLALVFVDGDHSYQGVISDAGFGDFLIVGGHILFHDCYDFDNPSIVHQLVPEVMQAVTDWYEGHKNEFEELPKVDTIRLFKRVKAHEFAGRSSADTDLQPQAGPDKGHKPPASKPAVRGATKNTGRGRQR